VYRHERTTYDSSVKPRSQVQPKSFVSDKIIRVYVFELTPSAM
jgi:hypothetical protein